jgi:hypothetical protein
MPFRKLTPLSKLILDSSEFIGSDSISGVGVELGLVLAPTTKSELLSNCETIAGVRGLDNWFPIKIPRIIKSILPKTIEVINHMFFDFIFARFLKGQ